MSRVNVMEGFGHETAKGALAYLLDFKVSIQEPMLAAFRATDFYEEGDEEDLPLFSEAFLYALIGKDKARGLLGRVDALRAAAHTPARYDCDHPFTPGRGAADLCGKCDHPPECHPPAPAREPSDEDVARELVKADLEAAHLTAITTREEFEEGYLPPKLDIVRAVAAARERARAAKEGA